MTIGERFADAVASGIGSWRFVGIQTAAIVFWLCLNTFSPLKPDKYPYMLLNFMLSLQAAYTGPVLLISAARQLELDRKRAIENLDLERLDNVHIEKILERLTQIEETIDEE